ncbi:MAG: aminopeptidase P family protein [Christensenellaceae bacterium]|nr:aminopeptidase P family protein [Christensenellaceae bacterium]
MSKSIMTIPRSEYDERIKKVQAMMADEGYDIVVTHACGCESATVRWLTNFWAVFDFVGVIIPKKGAPILLTGGPESYDFAVQFAQIDDIRVHPMYVETSAPEWDKPTNPYTYKKLFDELRESIDIKTIGIANPNTIPYQIVEDIKKGAPGAEFVDAELPMMKLRWYKSENELDILREAYRITEEGVKQVCEMIEPGVREWEIEAKWRSIVYQMGAEGTGYPVWVTSGPSTYQSLCKSTDRIIQNNEMVQLSLGAKYSGYCGNLCRAIVLGEVPEKHMNMIKVTHECLEDTVSNMAPGVSFAEVYDKFQAKLHHYGFDGLNLYGPAHGTGLQECEGPWVDNRGSNVFEPGMVFNIDIWIADDKYGVRIEDGIAVTDKGMEQLSTWHREPIIK